MINSFSVNSRDELTCLQKCITLCLLLSIATLYSKFILVQDLQIFTGLDFMFSKCKYLNSPFSRRKKEKEY